MFLHEQAHMLFDYEWDMKGLETEIKVNFRYIFMYVTYKQAYDPQASPQLCPS
jgi:hypothetical protein